MQECFAVAAPGLKYLLAQELQALGLLPSENEVKKVETGGVTFNASHEQIYRANLNLRTASRVLVRLGDFYAAAFSELRKKAGRLEWERYLTQGQPIAVHATCHRSRLYHTLGVAERVAGAIGDRLGQPAELFKGDEDAESQPQLILVRLDHDRCTISVDSSGALLHRRGYRLATAKAPLRETLAAAMLLAAGWDAAAALVDPFCGSGTIPIEAALLRAGLPPGRLRRFAFMDWPGYDPLRWAALLAEIQPKPVTHPAPILGSDRDAGAVQLARDNAARAGVAEWVDFSCRAVSAIDPPAGPGWVVTNPPYGQRVSQGKDLRNLYAQLGNVLRMKTPGWQVAILCSELKLLGQTGLHLDTTFNLVNGGIPVKVGRGIVS